MDRDKEEAVNDEPQEEGEDSVQELSFGKKAVGLRFNPSGDPTVQKIKELYAQIVDICHDAKNGPAMISSEKARLYSIAITEAQGAQMWAVKAATWDL